MEKLELHSELAIMILKSYLDKFYKYQKAKWETPHLEYQELMEDDNNFVDEYKFTYYDMHENDPSAGHIEDFIYGLNNIIKDEDLNGLEGLKDEKVLGGAIIAFDFGAHLYSPLIQVNAGDYKLTVSPVSLNKSEKDFVDQLRDFILDDIHLLKDMDIYLLRNKSKVGMGFFEADNFYPDFVFWINTPNIQYISFIDPKGLRMLQWDDPKIEFYAKIKELESRLEPTIADKRIVLNSFIMSGTPSEDLRHLWRKNGPERHAKNIFCLDDYDCIGKMFEKILE